MQHQLGLFQNTDTAKDQKALFKNALFSGELAGMVNESVRGEKICDQNALYNVLKPLSAQHPDVEKFYVVFLNAKNKIISIEAMFSGSITGCNVYPREIVKKCLEQGAVSICLAHNHPSGDPVPSQQDVSITKKILFACNTLGILVFDHLILGAKRFHSMKNDGQIDRFDKEFQSFF